MASKAIDEGWNSTECTFEVTGEFWKERLGVLGQRESVALMEQRGRVEGGGVRIAVEAVVDGGELELRSKSLNDRGGAKWATTDNGVGSLRKKQKGGTWGRHQCSWSCGFGGEANFSMYR